MDRLITFFTHNWQQKSLALLTALILWLFVNHSLQDTKILTNVPIKVINIPSDKTLVGMTPNGFLSRRINLTLTGSKGVIDELEPGDIEVVLDASTFDHDEQVLKINRKELRSLNPNLDVERAVSEVNHPEFILKMSNLVTRQVPIIIQQPKGEPPTGYEFLDIWPQKLTQTISGPEEQVDALMLKGFEITFDLSQISKTDLDRIKTSRENFHDDEVSYFIPASWKKIAIPFRNYSQEDINDPDAQNLHIDFLRKELFPIERELPVRIFFPLITSEVLNPKTLMLNLESKLKVKNDIPYLPTKLFVKDVSRLFLEIVRDHLIISIVATVNVKELPWGVSVIAPQALEDKYVSYLSSHNNEGKSSEPRHTKKRVSHLRARFRDFLQNLTLYTAPDKRFDLTATVEGNQVTIETMSINEH